MRTPSRHGIGKNNLKLVYDEIYDRIGNPSAGFSKKYLAEAVKPGQKIFVYVCGLQRVIGLAETLSNMIDRGVGKKWRYDVPLRWIVGPCTGVTLKEAGLSEVIRPAENDTNFILTDDESARLILLLEDKEPLQFGTKKSI